MCNVPNSSGHYSFTLVMGNTAMVSLEVNTKIKQMSTEMARQEGQIASPD